MRFIVWRFKILNIFLRAATFFSIYRKKRSKGIFQEEMIPFFITLREETKNECLTFVEQCLSKFFFFYFRVFVCFLFISQGKINFVVFNFKRSWEGGEENPLAGFLLIKRKLSCVFKLNKTYAREAPFRMHLTNDSSQIFARQTLVILIKHKLQTISKESVSLTEDLKLQSLL